MASIGKIAALDEADRSRISQTVAQLSKAKGDGTTLISLYIPGKQSQFQRARDMLTEEFSAAKCIKSKITQGLVQSALRSLQHVCKTVKSLPDNGMVLFSGRDLVTGREVMETIYPPREIKSLIYHCNKEFLVQPLRDQLEEGDKFGFIILSGSGVLLGQVQGTRSSVLRKWTVALPNKQNKGGQSANRYQRLVRTGNTFYFVSTRCLHVTYGDVSLQRF